MNSKQIVTLFTIIAMSGSPVFSEEPVAIESIPDDAEACAELILKHFQKSDMTEEEAKLKKKEFEAKEKAVLKKERMIKKVQDKKKKLQNKSDLKLQKANEYEKKIQYRINKIEEKKRQLETLIDVEEQSAEPTESQQSDDTAEDI